MRALDLVFLHEGLGSIGLWRNFPDDVVRATDDPSALVFSRHGYGRSSVVSEPRTPDYMHYEALTILPELLERFGIKRPVLVGHSDGASIALIHSAGGFEVAGLVLIAPHVFVEPCTLSAIEAARHAFQTTDLPIRLGRHHDDPLATFHGWSDTWLRDEFVEWNITGGLSRVTAPVLVVQGARDEYGTARQLDAISAGVSGPCETVLVADAHHAPHLEAPSVTLDLVARFVESLES